MFASIPPFGGGGGGGGAVTLPSCASTLEDLEFSCEAKHGYAETSVCIDIDKPIGKGSSKKVFLLTQNSDSETEFKIFKKVGSRPFDPNSYVMAIMSATTKKELTECLDEFFFSVQIHRCDIPMIKIHLCIVEIIFHDSTSYTITFDRNDYTVAEKDNSVLIQTSTAIEQIDSFCTDIFKTEKTTKKEYKVHFLEERGYNLKTTNESSEEKVIKFVTDVAKQYLALDFKSDNCLISLRNNNNQLVLCDADKQFFIPIAEVNAFFNYDCREGIIHYMLSLLYIDYYLYNKNKNSNLIALFGYLDENKLKQQLLNSEFLLFLAKNMFF